MSHANSYYGIGTGRGLVASPIKSPQIGSKGNVKSKLCKISEPTEPVVSSSAEHALTRTDHVDSNPADSIDEQKQLNFFERYQTLMRQKQISHHSKGDRSVLLVVKDDSAALVSKKESAKKRRGSAPSIQSPKLGSGVSVESPSTEFKSPKGNSMRSFKASAATGDRGPARSFHSPNTPFSPETSPGKMKTKTKPKSIRTSSGGLFINTEVLEGGRSGSGGKGTGSRRSPNPSSTPLTNSTANTEQQPFSPLESPIPKRLVKSNGKSKATKKLELAVDAVDAVDENAELLNAIGGHGEVANLSPRSKYLNACITENVFPRQALMKKVTEKSINIQNQGLGDKMTCMFMDCYRDSTTLESVNLTDNNLTDRGLAPAISAMQDIPSLTYVNISENIMGPQAAEALLALLDTEHCPVKQLVLRKCALDDLHCQCFVAALIKESRFSNLIELNMSNNKLGSSEVINASGQTTGEVIAAWLSRPECILQTLDLSWNTIRSHTGVVLSQCLAANHSLTHLDLSYNGLGTEGGSELGAALIHNKTLKFLSISNNNLDSVATFTICAGIMENSALEEVILDSNPIGEKGATALMIIPLIHFGRVKLSAKQCNLTIKDANCWFNFHNLPGRYVLKMSQPYERAVALVLLRLVSFHQSCEFVKVQYDPIGVFLNDSMLNGHPNGSNLCKHAPASVVNTAETASTSANTTNSGVNNASHIPANNSGSNRSVRDVHLVPRYVSREHLFDDNQRRILTKMRRMIEGSADAIHAMKLFREVDADDSNGIEQKELEQLMTSLGIHLSDYRLRETMATYDTDGNGSIDTEEFSCFLNRMRHEIEKHLHQLVNLPVLGLDHSLNDAVSGHGLSHGVGHSHGHGHTGGSSGTVGSEGSLITQRRHPTAAALHNGGTAIPATAVNILHSSKYGHCDDSEGRYRPPLTGTFLMEVEDSHTYKDVVYTVASCNRHYSDLVAQNTPDPDAVKRATLNLTQIRVDDAVGICQTIAKKKKNVIHVLVNLLHQVSSTADARLLISEVIDGDRSKMVKLRREMGHSLKATLGMLNGYYCLDLSVPTERKTLISLYQQSKTLNHHIAVQSPLGYGLTGDTSQKGNWSNFRNEIYEGRPVVIDEEFINVLPAYGDVEFDYSGEQRFREGEDVVLKDFAVVTMLIHVGLIRPADLDLTMANLKIMRLECNACNASLNGKTILERTWSDALDIAKHSCAFYEHLVSRPDYLERAKTLERIGGAGAVAAAAAAAAAATADSLNSTAESATKAVRSGSGVKRKNGSEGRGYVNETPQRKLKQFEPTPVKRTPLAAHLPNSRLYPNSAPASRGNSPVPARKTPSGPGASASNTPVKKHSSSSGYTVMNSPNVAISRKLSGGQQSKPNLTKSSRLTSSAVNINTVDEDETTSLMKSERTGTEVASFWKSHVLDNGHGLEDEEDEEYILDGAGSSAGGFGLPGEGGGDGPASAEYEDDTTKGDHFYGVIKAATSEEHASYFVSIIKNISIPDEVKMAKLVDIIEESFGCYKWIHARHLALILNCIECLPFGMANRSKYFGNYRVDIVVMLFGHIVDRANFDLVLKELNPYETACVISRIGVLNFANPMRPEGSHSLDLSLWDQRQLAKMYALLEVTEPGENWINKQFRWIIDQPPIPSWQLTKMWMTEEGMPARGLLDLTYYSGDCVGKNGCQPCIPYRKSLLFMSALNESDLKTEDQTPNQIPFREQEEASEDTQLSRGMDSNATTATPKPSTGLVVLKQNMDVWRDYIARDVYGGGPNVQVKPVVAPRRVRKTIGFSPARNDSIVLDVTPNQQQSPSGGVDRLVSSVDRLTMQSSSKALAKSMSKLSLSTVKRSANSDANADAALSSRAQMRSLQSASLAQLRSPREEPSTARNLRLQSSTRATSASRPRPVSARSAAAAKGPPRTVSTMKPNVTPRSTSTPRPRPSSGAASTEAKGLKSTKSTKSSSSGGALSRRNSFGGSKAVILSESKLSAALETILSPGASQVSGSRSFEDPDVVRVDAAPLLTRTLAAESAAKMKASMIANDRDSSRKPTSVSSAGGTMRKMTAAPAGTQSRIGTAAKTSAGSAISRTTTTSSSGTTSASIRQGNKYAHK